MKNTESAATTTTTAAVAQQGVPVASKQARATTKANAKKTAVRGQKTAKKPATKKTAAKTAAPEKTSAAGGSTRKKTAILDLLRRKDGATLAEIAKATGWKNHSIRGFISGTVGKRMGLKVDSSKNEAGERTYKIAGK